MFYDNDFMMMLLSDDLNIAGFLQDRFADLSDYEKDILGQYLKSKSLRCACELLKLENEKMKNEKVRTENRLEYLQNWNVENDTEWAVKKNLYG